MPAVGGLLGVDAGYRRSDIDVLDKHLLVLQHETDLANLWVGAVHQRLIEAGLFNAKGVGLITLQSEAGVTSIIRREPHLGTPRLLNRNLRIGNCRSGLINNDKGSGAWRLPGQKRRKESKEKDDQRAGAKRKPHRFTQVDTPSSHDLQS